MAVGGIPCGIYSDDRYRLSQTKLVDALRRLSLHTWQRASVGVTNVTEHVSTHARMGVLEESESIQRLVGKFHAL